MKDLLGYLSSRVLQIIDRIMWLYRRWQPIYTIIQRTVTPKVEFHQGIPLDLEDDEFFDPKLNNLLILDDLHSMSGKDRHITDLFSEGSHHRSLSIISINQNLYASKDPTHRRNCHYLELFNNPVDKQSIMTLARQMYPHNTSKFEKVFSKATKNPYGYLIVDLKPFTAEGDRLKNAIDWQEESQDFKVSVLTNQMAESLQPTIKETDLRVIDHCSVGDQTVHIDQENTMADKGQACDDCGLLFDSVHDVQRHMKNGWCRENREPLAKRMKTEESNESDIHTDDNIEDNEAFLQLWKGVKSNCKDKFDKIYQKYRDDGEDEDDATEMTEDRIKPFEKRIFFQKYSVVLEYYWLPLLNNATHTRIVESVKILISKGVSPSSAVRRLLNKNKGKFEDLFETDVSEDEDETSENESDEEE